jgi:hypothetical protein
VPVLALFTYVGSRADWRDMTTTALQRDNTTMYWSLYHSTVFIGYGLAALSMLERHLRRMRNAVSSLDTVGLIWLQRLIVAVIAAHLAHVVFDVLRLLDTLGPQPKIVLNLTATVAVIYRPSSPRRSAPRWRRRTAIRRSRRSRANPASTPSPASTRIAWRRSGCGSSSGCATSGRSSTRISTCPNSRNRSACVRRS